MFYSYLGPVRFFFYFWPSLIRFGVRFVRARRTAIRNAIARLHQIEQELEGSFDEATFQKVVERHGVHLPLVCDPFSALHARFTIAAEQERDIYYFICSSLLDDFFDQKTLTIRQINDIVFEPGMYKSGTFNERAFLFSHVFLLREIKHQQAYERVLRDVVQAQSDSLRQFDPHITEEEIQRITFSKGGNSLLLCRYYLDSEACEAEEQCWYRLGTMIQLCNDLADIYKDRQDAIQTLATRCTDAEAIADFFNEQVDGFRAQVALLPYPRKQKMDFSLAMAAIYSLGLVAIDNLRKLQVGAASLPPPEQVPREALILDMEKPANILRWVRYVHRHSWRG